MFFTFSLLFNHSSMFYTFSSMFFQFKIVVSQSLNWSQKLDITVPDTLLLVDSCGVTRGRVMLTNLSVAWEREGKLAAATSRAGLVKRLAVLVRWRGEAFNVGNELIKFLTVLPHFTN